jgi:predicted transcriptional regulator of viral defense system
MAPSAALRQKSLQGAGFSNSDLADACLARIAARQHGLLTRAQILRVGVGAQAIDYRVKRGRLHRIHNGVYALGHVPPSPLMRPMAAVLACGDGAVLSHRSAAVLWALLPARQGPIQITAAVAHHRRGVECHRTRLDRSLRTIHWGIPVTSPARTVVDLAAGVSDRELSRAFGEAMCRRLFS